MLILLEFGIHYDIFSPLLCKSLFADLLANISQCESIESKIKIKSKKISLILDKLTCLQSRSS